MGASCDTPWVCLPLFGMARAKNWRRGNYWPSAPKNKNPVFTVFTVFIVSAARSGTANHSGYTELGGKELPRGFAVPQFGMARAKRDRWVMLRQRRRDSSESAAAPGGCQGNKQFACHGVARQGEDGTGRATPPTATWLFFAKLFFHLEKKAEKPVPVRDLMTTTPLRRSYKPG